MGALVLAKSLTRVNTTKQLCLMITPGVSTAMRYVIIIINNTEYDKYANYDFLTHCMSFIRLHWQFVRMGVVSCYWVYSESFGDKSIFCVCFFSFRDVLNGVFDVVTEVNILDSEDAAHLALLDRPELGITFTKIHCWKLTQFTKCVFLDADTLVCPIFSCK